MKKIINFFKNLELNVWLFLIAVVLGVILFYQRASINNLKADRETAKQNQYALKDTIKITKDRLGNAVYEKGLLVSDKKHLAELSQQLKQEIDELNGRIVILTSIGAIIIHDTMYTTNQIYTLPDGSKSLSWQFENIYSEENYRRLAGKTNFYLDTMNMTVKDKGTTITEDLIHMNIITGINKNDKGLYNIFVKTDYPGMKFDKIEGAALDQKMFMKQEESNIVFGPAVFVGYGLNPVNKTLGPQVSVGFALTYNLNKSIKKIFK